VAVRPSRGPGGGTAAQPPGYSLPSPPDPDPPEPPEPEPPEPEPHSKDRDDATADEGPVRSGWYGLLVLVLALVCLVGAIFGYDWLASWYRPVQLTASTSNVGQLAHLTLTSSGGNPVHWKVVTGTVRQLLASEPADGMADVILPLPAAACPKLASELGTTCASGGRVAIGAPATLTWSTAQTLQTVTPVSSSGLDIASTAIRPAALTVTLSARTDQVPTFCFDWPLQAATLTISENSAHPVPVRFPGHQIVPCSAGVQLLIGTAGQGEPPAIELAGIGNLTIRATAAGADLQGFAGLVDLNPGGSKVLASPTVLSVHSRAPVLLSTDFQVGPSGQQMTMSSGAADSVMTDTGQLVPAEWSRQRVLTVPILGGFVTALVFTPLGVAVQVLMDWLKKWRGPRGLRRKWRAFRERPRPAGGT
jgi:hypothetical protein